MTSTELSAQETFDRVVERLRDGTGQAKTGSFCRYLTEDGLKCAAGIFIPDGHEAQYSTLRVRVMLDAHEDLRETPIGKHTDLVAHLQNIHDDDYCWEGKAFTGEHRLKRTASLHDLKYDAPKETAR